MLESPVEKVTSVAWAADNRTLFYSIPDAAKRPYRVYRHIVGQKDDVLLHDEKDERFSVGVSRSRSRGFVLIEIGSLTTSEVQLPPARRRPPASGRRLRRGRTSTSTTSSIAATSSTSAPTRADATSAWSRRRSPIPSPSRWTPLVPHRADVMLQGVMAFRDYLVLYERANGLSTLRVAKVGSND